MAEKWSSYMRRRPVTRRTFLKGAALAGGGAATAVLIGCGDDDDDGGSSAMVWGYSGDGAPSRWAELSGDYSVCGEGREQSPIDITGAVNGDLPPLEFSYAADGNHVRTKNLFLKVSFEGESGLRVGGDAYTLLQVHAHTPSEHTVEGESFPLELHLVHQDAGGNLAVVGLLYREGAANAAVGAFLDTAPGRDAEAELETLFSAAALPPADGAYFTYDGSLTTPPCSEGVRWLVMATPQEVSAEQAQAIKRVAGGGENNRPVQPIGARTITRSA